ncbi:L-Aspartase-like protein [Leptodontidium sp. MPI-SDFR-AT-0119]|nr:L-Aspartase-like protein [Leptodontidium sp. MPI-SDFR-AT-0119]
MEIISAAFLKLIHSSQRIRGVHPRPRCTPSLTDVVELAIVSFYSQPVFDYSNKLISVLEKRRAIELQGDALIISDVVAVSQYKTKANIDHLPPEIVAKIDGSVQFLRQSLEEGTSIYGVNTGFGGRADTSTTAAGTLQVALLQMQLSAVLPVSGADNIAKDNKEFQYQMSIPDGVDTATLSMPESWVQGHSAVCLDIIKDILKFLEHDLVPLVPLRGSISASGDLCPLSYIAGALEGNPDVRVWWRDGSARKNPGLLNGTGFPVAVAAIAHHKAETLATLAQILTAMGVEALLGTAESFDPFIAAVRLHSGQIEVAHNIRAFLKGSKLARFHHASSTSGHLRQYQYALRTSSQWLRPGLEDMALSRCQLEIELNSTTDNPLVDVEHEQIHHGGNFQASSLELLDSRLAYNLPPSLAVDEPSLSYSMKGVDINMASYMSELAYIANLVSNHVHSAEMSNQSLNSLALISARYTHTAVDLVSLMSSAYLCCLCQALDLRAMNRGFIARLKPELEDAQLAELHISIWKSLQDSLAASTSKDSSERFFGVAQPVQHIVISYLATSTTPPPKCLNIITTWTATLAETLKTIFNANRTSYLTNPDATPYLGNASKCMHLFGIVDHPNFGSGSVEDNIKRNTGSRISCIYRAIRDGSIVEPVLGCLKGVGEVDRNGAGGARAKL